MRSFRLCHLKITKSIAIRKLIQKRSQQSLFCIHATNMYSLCLQVRQLLLDPAVNHEFERILKALEDKTAEAKRLHEELKATNFQYESKQGRMLMAKCRTLTVRSTCTCYSCWPCTRSSLVT